MTFLRPQIEIKEDDDDDKDLFVHAANQGQWSVYVSCLTSIRTSTWTKTMEFDSVCDESFVLLENCWGAFHDEIQENDEDGKSNV